MDIDRIHPGQSWRARRRPLSLRRSAKAVALVGGAFLLAVLTASPALADSSPPEGWENPPPVSTISALLLLVAVPAALFVLITFAVLVPSLMRGDRYTPGRTWRGQSTWFGGPQEGVQAVDEVRPQGVEAADSPTRGGASAQW